jgi:hypothetical protein
MNIVAIATGENEQLMAVTEREPGYGRVGDGYFV